MKPSLMTSGQRLAERHVDRHGIGDAGPPVVVEHVDEATHASDPAHQPLLVAGKERRRPVGEVDAAGEQGGQSRFLLDQAVGEDQAVLGGVEQVRCHVVEDLDRGRQRLEVLTHRGHPRVEAGQVGVQRVDGRGQLVATTLQRLRRRADRRSELGRAERLDQSVDVVEGLLELQRALGDVGLDRRRRPRGGPSPACRGRSGRRTSCRRRSPGGSARRRCPGRTRCRPPTSRCR